MLGGGWLAALESMLHTSHCVFVAGFSIALGGDAAVTASASGHRPAACGSVRHSAAADEVRVIAGMCKSVNL